MAIPYGGAWQCLMVLPFDISYAHVGAGALDGPFASMLYMFIRGVEGAAPYRQIFRWSTLFISCILFFEIL